MEPIRAEQCNLELLKELKIDCSNCCGICCIALYCSKAEGFPADKEAGTPCKNLMPDFRCRAHTKLPQLKLKGCMAFDCMGAGQKVTQNIFGGANWHTSPQYEEQMFQGFFKVYQLHQMLWYLMDGKCILSAEPLTEEIVALIDENRRMTGLSPDEILMLNLDAYQADVNHVLKEISALVRFELNLPDDGKHTTDYIGKNFNKANLRGKDFSMSLLIAANLESCNLYGANFLGADLRDANLNDADLSQSIFLTQMQINSAKGSRGTKLPSTLTYPETWKKTSN
jgi:uncharacterized protein YjbI with pentapeptide repeats